MNIFKNIYLHIKYYFLLKKVYKNEDILRKMSELLQTNVRIDWVGRIYMVLNPNTIKQSEKVYELLDGKLDDSAFIEKWVMERLIVMEKFIKANNLFDLLTFNIKRIDEYNNFLFILEPITFKEFKKSVKWLNFLIILIILISIIFYQINL